MADIYSLVELAGTDSDRAADAWHQLAEQGGRAVNALTEVIRTATAPVRANLSQALMRMQTEQALPELVELMDDELFELRFAAYVAVGLSGSEEAAQPLIRRLQDGSPSESAWAAHALSDLRDISAVPAIRERLERLIESESYEFESNLVAALVIALAKFGIHDRASVIFDLLASESLEARVDVAKALPSIITRGIIDKLTDRISDEDELLEVRTDAVDALTLIGLPDAFDVLVARLSDSDPEIRERAQHRLAGLAGSQFVTQEEAITWWQENQRSYADRVVYRLGRPLHVEDLVELLAHPMTDWRDVLAELRIIGGAAFGTSPFMILSDAERDKIVARVTSWWQGAQPRFTPGTLYKYGQAQDEVTLR